MKYRKIKEADDQKIAEIIRENLQRRISILNWII